MVLRSARRFGRFFRSPLPQHHVALSGEHHADTCAALADPNLSSLVGPVLGKPGGEFWVVRSAPLELKNAGGVFHLLAFDHRYLTPSERERECQLALDRKVFGRAARVETSRWIVAL